jgi:hypothetical protein
MTARDDPSSPLDHVVDDSSARDECVQWAFAQLGGGSQTAEEVVADLVANGWSRDDAEAIAEEARRRTRVHRGVTTREDAARAYGVGDPSVMRNSTPCAKPGHFGALGSLCNAIGRLWRTKDVGRGRKG